MKESNVCIKKQNDIAVTELFCMCDCEDEYIYDKNGEIVNYIPQNSNMDFKVYK